MTATTAAAVPQPLTTPDTLTPEKIASFRENGFVHIPGIITPEEAARFYTAALETAHRLKPLSTRPVFRSMSMSGQTMKRCAT
jgi:hypothetical protein